MSLIITKDKYPEIIDLYTSGYKQKDIAAIYNVDQTTISDILTKLGVHSLNNGRRVVNVNEYDNIITMYLNGMKQKDIASQYNVSSSVIGTILRNNNVHPRTRLSEKTRNDIIDMYLSGKNKKYISDTINVSYGTVSRVLKENSIQFRSRSNIKKVYNCNEHYFDEIDTPNKAYILGILYADGCITDDRHVSLTLQDRDIDILNKINKELNSDRPLLFVNKKRKKSKWKNCYQLIFNSEHMVNMLIKHGCFKKKSLILKYPIWLDFDLQRHFLRGYMDGDGSISKNPKKMSVSFVGIHSFITEATRIAQKYLRLHVYIFIKTLHENADPTSIFNLNHKRDACIFLDWIYRDADLYMQCKYDIYKSIYSNNNINNNLLN